MSAEDEVTDTETGTTEEVENTTATEETSTEDTSESTEPRYTPHEIKMFQRAKEAEAKVKKLEAELQNLKPKQPQTGESYDLEDVAVLVSQVPLKEDRDIVKRAAKILGKNLEDALNDPVVKGMLKEKAELRKTAEATNTAGSKRTTPKVTDEQIIERFQEGKGDPEAVAIARMNLRKQALSKR